MILKQVSYTYDKDSELHVFEDINLQESNLIVGPNATGKSRLLKVINSFPNMLLKNSNIYWGDYELKFFDKELNQTIIYKLRKKKNYLSEQIVVNGDTILNRENQDAQLWDELNKEDVVLSPPMDELVPHIRRDVNAFPHLEKILKWARGVYYFNFGAVQSSNFFDIGLNEKSVKNSLSDWLDEIKEDELNDLMDDLNAIDFPVDSISYDKARKLLLITESGITTTYDHTRLSSGIFRIVALLLAIKFMSNQKDYACLLVDDFCEGLDYNRSSKLGKVIFDRMRNRNVQLIVTSNDAFLMNIVPIKYWNILRRDQNKTISFNIVNSGEKFERFQSLGLNNFDLFTSDFLEH